MWVSIAHRVQVFAVILALVGTIALPGTSFGVDLYSQNFEGVTLGPTVTYGEVLRDREAWSPNFPAGWVRDNSGFPGAVTSDPNIGAAEFEGWTVVDKNWWVANEDQGRGGFFNGLGKVALADTDEHDDFPIGGPAPSTLGPYDAKLSTPSIALQGAAPNTVNMTFHSSWMPEEIQKATLTARYNTGANVEVLRWHSPAADPMFHDSATNETVTLPLQNPAGATSVTLDFRLFDATNNWFWAIDNISVYTGGAPASDAVLRAIVDRDTNNVKILNNTGAAVNLRGYSLRSANGAFNEPNATFLADSVANWIQLTAPNATGDLSEGHLSSASLANGGMINFGNNVWRRYFQDDVTFQYLVAGNDDPIPGIVEFTGNGGASFPFLDLNFNGVIDPGDWDTFRAGFPVSLAGLSVVQRYQLGDLDNNGLHTANDFIRFRTEYDAALGAGAFDAALAASEVPEPATIALLIFAILAPAGIWWRGLRGRLGRVLPAVGLLMLILSASSAQAQLTLFSENFEGLVLGPNVEEGLAGSAVWTETPPAGWTKNDAGVPGALNPPPDPNNGIWEWAGWSFADKTWWATTAGGQGRENYSLGSGTVMIADPDEWDDGAHPDVSDTGSTAACTDSPNPCMYDAFITTPTFVIPAGIPAGRIKIAFDSS
ncbi:MAG: hypothetical protein WD229_13155, partial [Pirellulales bacterium]